MMGRAHEAFEAESPDANAWSFRNVEVIDLRPAVIAYGKEDRLPEIVGDALTAFHARMGHDPQAIVVDETQAGILDKLGREDDTFNLVFAYHVDKGKSPVALYGIPIWVAR